jgi:hypothetical protein
MNSLLSVIGFLQPSFGESNFSCIAAIFAFLISYCSLLSISLLSLSILGSRPSKLGLILSIGSPYKNNKNLVTYKIRLINDGGFLFENVLFFSLIIILKFG